VLPLDLDPPLSVDGVFQRCGASLRRTDSGSAKGGEPVMLGTITEARIEQHGGGWKRIR
jgi:hypothetical protein